MAYTARLLINRAFYLSGIVAREFEEVSGEQTQTGLFLLNSLLSYMTGDLKLVPYFSRIPLNLVQGQEEYFVPNLYSIETFTYDLQTVRWPVSIVNRIRYFGSGRANDIQSIPYMVHPERAKGGLKLYVWFKPNANYAAVMTGKMGLTNVTLDTDLDAFYDDFYIEMLRYYLAKYICNDYKMMFDKGSEDRLTQMIKQLNLTSPPDLTNKKISLIATPCSLNYGQANIGKGWTVP